MRSQICRQFCNGKCFLGDFESTGLASVGKFLLSVTRFPGSDICYECVTVRLKARIGCGILTDVDSGLTFGA